MDKTPKEALQVAKEIVVKYIETGRMSPANFAEVFPAVYVVVLQTITQPCAMPEPTSSVKEAGK